MTLVAKFFQRMMDGRPGHREFSGQRTHARQCAGIIVPAAKDFTLERLGDIPVCHFAQQNRTSAFPRLIYHIFREKGIIFITVQNSFYSAAA
jgi:hypothetical protein